MRFTTAQASAWFSALLLSTSVLGANVTLPYGTFIGVDSYTNDQGTPLVDPLIAYLGIPYAAPPTGKLRYSLPQPPLKTNGTVSAQTYGPMCLQAGTGDMDEDCLSLNVFVPSGTKKGSKLPVVVFSRHCSSKAIIRILTCCFSPWRCLQLGLRKRVPRVDGFQRTRRTYRSLYKLSGKQPCRPVH